MKKNIVFRKALVVGIIVLFVGAGVAVPNIKMLTPARAMETLNGDPFEPIDPLPENNSENISINPAISVLVTDPDNDTMNVSFYNASDDSFIDVAEDVQNGTRAEVIWSDLQYNTTYSWYAVADDGEYTNQSDTWNFTTTANHPPNEPSDPNPANESINVSLNADLNWTGGDPYDDPVTYDIYFGTNSTPSKVVNNQTNTTYYPEILNENTTYYWKIIAWDDIGLFTEGPIWKFTTGENRPPYPPIISGPSFGGPGIALNFSAITSDPEGDEVYYKWEWGDGNYSDWLGPYDINISIVTNHSWDESREYEIRAKAKDTTYGAESNWSEPHNISISKQIEINNLKPGFIYFHIFTFNKSYLYLHMFEILGITGMISTENFLLVNATVTESVDLVKFEANQLLMNMITKETDDNMSDGANTLFSLDAGLFEITAYAYDEEGNIIDNDKVDYLILFCPSLYQNDGGMIRRALLNRRLMK